MGAAMSAAVALAKDASAEAIFDVLGVDIPSADGKQRVQSVMNGSFPFQSSDASLEAATKAYRSQVNLVTTINTKVFKLADIVMMKQIVESSKIVH